MVLWSGVVCSGCDLARGLGCQAEPKEARRGPGPFHCVTTALLFFGLMGVQKALKDKVHIGRGVEG